jgi:hypothetical protein
MSTYRIAALLLGALLPLGSANAQLDNLVGQGKGELKGLSGAMSGQSLTSGSLGNVAGLLQYCVSNNFLSGEGVGSVQEKLMAKVPGGSKSNDPAYNDGLKGVLHSSEGSKLDLSGGGMKQELTKKACDTVLAQAKTFL